MRLKTSPTLTRVEIHHLEIRGREFELGETVAAVPIRGVGIAVLIDPHLLVLGGLFGYGGVDEAEVLRADAAAGDVVFDEGEGHGGTVAAVADVEHVFGAAGEGDDVDDVDPGSGGRFVKFYVSYVCL